MKKMGKVVWFAVLVMIFGTGCNEISAIGGKGLSKVIWLDQLDVSKATEGWGKTQANKSIDGNPLKIAGVSYQRGIGTHAKGQFCIKLHKAAKRFTALVGIDDEITVSTQGQDTASVEFLVVGDDKVLWKSGVMKAGQKAKQAKQVDVDLSGVDVLKLIVTTGGNSNYYVYADWVNAKIEFIGKTPVAVAPKRPKPYILTPKPGPKPRLTGPKVFGVRPGSPFLFTVTAAGWRPIRFEAEGLPNGLTLDPKTGRITGTVNKRGTYIVKLRAKNWLGKDERDFRIEVGDTICLTPPMGWNSWNCWGCAVDAEKVKATARAMVEKGLINHGWSYINIDDCWMRKPNAKDPVIGGKTRDENGRILPNAKFPDMKALTDYIHSLGLKAGIYISPGPYTCQGYEGSYGHELDDAKQFAEWGFDYLKYDWCGYSQIRPHPDLEQLKEPYILMRKQLDKVNRDIVYSLCQYGWGNVWQWGAEVGGNCWRTTGDIVDTWESMAGIGFSQDKCSPYAGPGHWNDPDMLVVGKVGWGPNLHPSRLTPDEQYTHISLWCLLSAPLLIGCPIEQIDDFTLSLLTNDEVLDVNQDPLGQAARCIAKGDNWQVWAKDMEDGSKAVGLFNLDDFKKQQVSIDFKTLGIEGKQIVRDLWRQKNLGKFDKQFSAEVPSHGVVLVKITPVKKK